MKRAAVSVISLLAAAMMLCSCGYTGCVYDGLYFNGRLVWERSYENSAEYVACEQAIIDNYELLEAAAEGLEAAAEDLQEYDCRINVDFSRSGGKAQITVGSIVPDETGKNAPGPVPQFSDELTTTLEKLAECKRFEGISMNSPRPDGGCTVWLTADVPGGRLVAERLSEDKASTYSGHFAAGNWAVIYFPYE